MLKYGREFGNLFSFATDVCSAMKGASKGITTKRHGKLPRIIDIHCNVMYNHFGC